MKVSVSILKEINNYKEAIKKINLTDADYVHLDITDNTMTNTSSFKVEDFSDIEKYNDKKLDIHLMSTNLKEKINEYISLEPEYITFHVESTNDVLYYINLIKENNIKVGLALKEETDISQIKPYLDKIDLILIMSVKLGFGGQDFNKSILKKLIYLKSIDSKPMISIDGGINNQTIGIVKDYVDMVVSGSFITDSKDYSEKVKLLKSS